MSRPFFLIAVLVLCLAIAVQASPVLDSRAGSKGKAQPHAQPHPSKPGSSSSKKPKPATFPTSVKACAAHDSCNDCVESKNTYDHEGKTVVAKCIWTQGGERGKCSVAPSGTEEPKVRFARTLEQCSAIKKEADEAKAKAEKEAAIHAEAEKVWSGMSAHVLEGGNDAASGRHLATVWLKANPKSLIERHVTQIGTTTFGSNNAAKAKTLWLDGGKDAHASTQGSFTKKMVAQMCLDAIKSSIMLNKAQDQSKPLKGINKFVVKAPNTGHHLCVELIDDKTCYPAGHEALPNTTKLGDICPEMKTKSGGYKD